MSVTVVLYVCTYICVYIVVFGHFVSEAKSTLLMRTFQDDT